MLSFHIIQGSVTSLSSRASRATTPYRPPQVGRYPFILAFNNNLHIFEWEWVLVREFLNQLCFLYQVDAAHLTKVKTKFEETQLEIISYREWDTFTSLSLLGRISFLATRESLKFFIVIKFHPRACSPYEGDASFRNFVGELGQTIGIHLLVKFADVMYLDFPPRSSQVTDFLAMFTCLAVLPLQLPSLRVGQEASLTQRFPPGTLAIFFAANILALFWANLICGIGWHLASAGSLRWCLGGPSVSDWSLSVLGINVVGFWW